eukprot:CAMPEP_0202979410 /NCGR_PEP_ID=MMETSP1396-20130829/85567_1 /ASSEMBLY_ACC=CAM_ASM_000872 /TAXON_ID= /ORGANISM="Pseudokeronopsis sp., Strain Brazil" /LENGTH=173 /DNA_ID=CAMNT_0049718819 /DNA_START=659 /DNA_END=1180 /DNA_ORIENTATION=-
MIDAQYRRFKHVSSKASLQLPSITASHSPDQASRTLEESHHFAAVFNRSSLDSSMLLAAKMDNRDQSLPEVNKSDIKPRVIVGRSKKGLQTIEPCLGRVSPEFGRNKALEKGKPRKVKAKRSYKGIDLWMATAVYSPATKQTRKTSKTTLKVEKMEKKEEIIESLEMQEGKEV